MKVLIVGGGVAFSFYGQRWTGLLDGEYRGANDSDEFIGKAQMVFQLN